MLVLPRSPSGLSKYHGVLLEGTLYIVWADGVRKQDGDHVHVRAAYGRTEAVNHGSVPGVCSDE